MNKKYENSKNRLGLNLFEANLKRHPSVKCLFDEEGNMKSPSQSKDELLLLNIDNKSEKESNDTSNNNGEEEENEEKEKKIQEIEKENNINESKQNDKNDKNDKKIMSVQINRVEEKLVDNKETFFVEMNDEEKKEILKKKIDIQQKIQKYSKPLNYGFNDLQKKIDKDITEAISKGKKYSKIEVKFINQLKK